MRSNRRRSEPQGIDLDKMSARIDIELARRKLAHFVRFMWAIIEPTTPLVWNWHLDAICEHLEAVHRGEIKNLVINVPPRSLKSSIISVLFPCWEWLHNPTHRYLTASHALKLAIRDAVRSRRVMQSERYRVLMAFAREEQQWVFTGDQNEKSRYENNRTGYRVCTAPGSGTTGEGGTRLIGDDILSAMDALSDTIRESTNEWLDLSFSTRLNDPKTSAKILVMQRLHENDPTGHVLAQGGYEWLCLPTIYECDHPGRRTTSIGFTDPRTQDGELLSPDHFDADAVAEARLRLGTFAFVGQHQQRPAPAEGGVFQRKWFRFWKTLPPAFDRKVQSWDFTFKGKRDGNNAAELDKVRDPDFVVGDAWGFVGANAYLLAETRGQWEFKLALSKFIEFAVRNADATKKLIEAKANGPAIMSMLSDKIPGLEEVEPQGSKLQRAYAVQAFVEAGNVFLPDPSIAPWIEDWLDEICKFPFARRDDRVDTMTQVLINQNVNELSKSLRRLQSLSIGIG